MLCPLCRKPCRKLCRKPCRNVPIRFQFDKVSDEVTDKDLKNAGFETVSPALRVSGPAAATQATARALAKAGDSKAIVLVEGISDQIALETLAVRRGRDLDAERVVILPTGGAQAIVRHLPPLGPKGAGSGREPRPSLRRGRRVL